MSAVKYICTKCGAVHLGKFDKCQNRKCGCEDPPKKVEKK